MLCWASGQFFFDFAWGYLMVQVTWFGQGRIFWFWFQEKRGENDSRFFLTCLYLLKMTKTVFDHIKIQSGWTLIDFSSLNWFTFFPPCLHSFELVYISLIFLNSFCFFSIEHYILIRISNFSFVRVKIIYFLFIKIYFLFVLHVKNSFHNNFNQTHIFLKYIF